MHSSWLLSLLPVVANAACPYMDGSPDLKKRTDSAFHERDNQIGSRSSDSFLDQFTVDDSDSYITSDAGGPIQDSTSLKAGERGPTLLEDFIFRQKITHFDHERVCHAYLLLSLNCFAKYM